MVRKSLSDWYRRPEGSKTWKKADKEKVIEDGQVPAVAQHICMSSGSESDREANNAAPTSPTKRRKCPTVETDFFIGDDGSDCSDLASISRRMTPMATVLEGVEPSCTPVGGSIDPAITAALRTMCADYFENNVSPILKYVQSTQDQVMEKLKDLSAKIDRKANADDTLSPAEVEKVVVRVAAAREESTKVSVQIRLEELAASLRQKADANMVPTLSQLGMKANAKDVPTSEQMAKVVAALEGKADISAIPALAPADLEDRIRTAEEKVTTLREELQELKSAGAASKPVETDQASDTPGFKKLQVVVAAAGARVDRQLREIRKQMLDLRSEFLGNNISERWPGRRLSAVSDGNDSDTLSVGSIEGSASLKSSFGGSASGLDPDEKAQLKKMQTVFAAAGASFGRDLRELRQEIKEVHAEVAGVKQHMGVCTKLGK